MAVIVFVRVVYTLPQQGTEFLGKNEKVNKIGGVGNIVISFKRYKIGICKIYRKTQKI